METIYELIDEVRGEVTAGKLADYLWMNYPDYAEDLMEEIESRVYLGIMDRIEHTLNFKKGE